MYSISNQSCSELVLNNQFFLNLFIKFWTGFNDLLRKFKKNCELVQKKLPQDLLNQFLKKWLNPTSMDYSESVVLNPLLPNPPQVSGS